MNYQIDILAKGIHNEMCFDPKGERPFCEFDEDEAVDLVGFLNKNGWFITRTEYEPTPPPPGFYGAGNH